MTGCKLGGAIWAFRWSTKRHKHLVVNLLMSVRKINSNSFRPYLLSFVVATVVPECIFFFLWGEGMPHSSPPFSGGLVPMAQAGVGGS